MANAKHDKNNVPTIIAVLNTNGTTITNITASPVSHGVGINDGSSGTDHGRPNAFHDSNNVPTWMAVSSSDGKTPIILYADPSGNLLVKST